jgi:hypothetical protein
LSDASDTTEEHDERLERPYVIHTYGDSEDLFKVDNTDKFDKYKFDFSAAAMKGNDIAILRRHEYYKGWYDCMKETCLKSIVDLKPYLAESSPYKEILNREHVRSPLNAGLNAGVTFTFSALCQQYNVEYNKALDDYEWTMSSLVPNYLTKEALGSDFWIGFVKAKEDVEARFWDVVKEGRERREGRS